MAQLPVNGILASQAHSISIHEFASSIAALLDAADRDFDKDLPAAKASIAKASLLLRIEMGRGETQSANDPSHGGLTGWQCQRIRAYVDSHLDQHIQISDLCAVARRSEGHFYRIFKRTFGETPHSYIVGRRLERAKQLMIDTDVFLTEIAHSCGFVDQAHLCKLFRAKFGRNPSAWRKDRRALQALAGLDQPRTSHTLLARRAHQASG